MEQPIKVTHFDLNDSPQLRSSLTLKPLHSAGKPSKVQRGILKNLVPLRTNLQSQYLSPSKTFHELKSPALIKYDKYKEN